MYKSYDVAFVLKMSPILVLKSNWKYLNKVFIYKI